LIFGLGTFVLALVAAVLIHEFAHVAMAGHFGVKTKKLRLLPFGGVVEIEANFLPPKQKALILLAGPFANIIVILVTGSLLWIAPQFFMVWEILIFANAAPALLNLLPIYPFDGGKILMLISKNPRYLRIIQSISATLFSLLATIGAFVLVNPQLVLFAVMMVVIIGTELEQSEFTHLFCQKKSGKIIEVQVTSNTTLHNAYKKISRTHFTKFVVSDRNNKYFYENDLEHWMTANNIFDKLDKYCA